MAYRGRHTSKSLRPKGYKGAHRAGKHRYERQPGAKPTGVWAPGPTYSGKHRADSPRTTTTLKQRGFFGGPRWGDAT